MLQKGPLLQKRSNLNYSHLDCHHCLLIIVVEPHSHDHPPRAQLAGDPVEEEVLLQVRCTLGAGQQARQLVVVVSTAQAQLHFHLTRRRAWGAVSVMSPIPLWLPVPTGPHHSASFQSGPRCRVQLGLWQTEAV